MPSHRRPAVDLCSIPAAPADDPPWKGIRWMAQREDGGNDDGRKWAEILQKMNVNAAELPAGGILADDMGLGKTLMALGLIAWQDGRREDAKRRVTVLIVTKSTLSTWQKNVEEMLVDVVGAGKTSGSSRRVHAGIKKKFKLFVAHRNECLPSHLGSYSAKNTNFILLTTYETVAAREAEVQALVKKLAPKRFVFVCDEAHKLGNRTSKISQAVANVVRAASSSSVVSSENKPCCWALSGTPMTNKVEEIYGIFRFLQLKPLADFAWFQTLFGKKIHAKMKLQSGGAVDGLAKTLQLIMLRRKKDQKVVRNGREEDLLQLPACGTELRLPVRLCAKQSAAYRRLYELACDREARLETEEKRKKPARQNTALGSARIAPMTMIIRLRQLCQDPQLLPPELWEYITTTLDEKGRESNMSSESQFRKIEEILIKWGNNLNAKRSLVDLWCDDTALGDCPMCLEPLADDDEATQASELQEVQMTECGHVFHAKCLKQWLAAKEKSAPCAVCRHGPLDAKKFRTRPKDFRDQYEQKQEQEAKTKANPEDKKEEKAQPTDTENFRDFVSPKALYVHRLLQQKYGSEFLPRVANNTPTIKNAESAPVSVGTARGKVVIFSEFREQLQLLREQLFPPSSSSNLPDQDGVAVYLDGSMSRKHCDAAIERFQDPNSSAKVLLGTYRTAGLGVTLTAADVVILLHPFWNHANEQQAVDRVRRIGSSFSSVCVFKLIAEVGNGVVEGVCGARAAAADEKKINIERWLVEMQELKAENIRKGMGDERNKAGEAHLAGAGKDDSRAAQFFRADAFRNNLGDESGAAGSRSGAAKRQKR